MARDPLIGAISSIEHFCPKTQGDILRVVVRDMQQLPETADRIKRNGGGYVWVIAAKDEAVEA